MAPKAAPAKRRTFDRSYGRPVVAALAPAAIAVYFWIIWRLYLVPPESANGLVFNRPGGQAVYYSWFVLAALGLSISQFGLESVERSMMPRQMWAPIGAGGTPTKPHVAHTWARPDGWVKVLENLIFRGQRPAPGALKIWTLLASVTLLAFLGLPLSGLAMNFGTGHYLTTQTPITIGFTNSSWNLRFRSELYGRAFAEWRSAAASSMPAAGVIYTRAGQSRAHFAGLTRLPNTLPEDVGVSDMFLAPQASTPIYGASWGLAFGYNCSVVKEASEFSILTHRVPNTDFGINGAYSEYRVLEGDARIRIFNVSLNEDTNAANVQAVAELGYDHVGQVQRESGSLPPASECYNPIPLPGTNEMPYPGLDQPHVIELALWQNLSTPTYFETQPAFNVTLPDTIPELLGAYNATMPFGNASNPMAAVGVRCTSVSEVGTANLDGRTASFSDFRRSNTTYRQTGSAIQCAERLSLGVPHLLFSDATTNKDTTGWITNFFSSVGKIPQAFSFQDFRAPGNQVTIQTSYLQATDLQRSLIRAFAFYTTQLLYNGGVGYVNGNGTYVLSNSTNEEAKAYALDTVLVPGVIPPALVAVLLTLWGFGSLVISIIYGFRRPQP